MRSSTLQLMSLAGAPASAATFGDFASALARREANTYNIWDTLRAIKGAHWYNKDAAGAAFARKGTLLDKASLTQQMKSQLPPQSLIEPVRGACAGAGVIDGVSIFRIKLSGRQPLYLRVE